MVYQQAVLCWRQITKYCSSKYIYNCKVTILEQIPNTISVFDLRKAFFSLLIADIDGSVRHPLSTMRKMFSEIQPCELLAFSCQTKSSYLCSASAAAWDISACYDNMRTCPSKHPSDHLAELSIPSVWCQTTLETHSASPWTGAITSAVCNYEKNYECLNLNRV